MPVFELDCSHDYSDEDFYGSSGKSFYESRDKGGKSKKIHRHHPYDGRLVLRSGEREPYDGHLDLRSGEGETSLFFSQSATDVNLYIPKNEDPENSEIELVIVAVTKMPDGKCLMGFDQRDRFWRPIYKTEVGDYSWDKKKWFTLGNKYKFTRRPIAARGDFPHRTEDIMVLEDVEDLNRRSCGLFDRMLRIAKEKPEDIFPQLEYENGKIFVDTTVYSLRF